MHRSRVVSDMGSSGDTGQRYRGLGGRDQGGVGPAAAAAAQDAAGQVGGSGGDHAACAQRQSGRNGRRTAACIQSLGYGWISRFLANGLVCCDDVMAPFAREILAWLAESGEPIPLILDQTKASD